MTETLFTGVCTALVTPFLGDSINYPLVEVLLKRQIDAGIRAVVLSGTTGESPALSDSEKLELFHRAKSYVGNDCKIFAGTGSNNTAHSVRLSKLAQESGIDGLLVVSPYYNKGTIDSLEKHFYSISQAVSIPIILYNVPSRTGQDMPVELYRRLSKLVNIAGVKEAGTDLTKITKIRSACGSRFAIWSGNDDLTVPVISLGGLGVISVTANIAPKEVAAMTNAALDGDFDTAAELQTRLQTLNELMFCEVNPVPVKAAMRYIGYDCGICRLPLGDASAETKKKLSQFFG
ncbi:MAG: 4-hydroxy-tetrahydrodipicolinate synthase [Oscillospiraceae bacterium]|nr:4-hydroxy-tetrahydrodipicolinate synthase [Oscillospiraceae bacterium]